MTPVLYQGSYCGPPPDPATLWTQWNFDPFVLVPLLILLMAVWRRPAGLVAVAVLFVTFVSPLCALTVALFSARVVHHLLLIAVAAPLLAAAWPGTRAMRPGVLFGVATITLWLWHLPAAYDAALGNVAIYWLMQATLFGSAVAFWRAVLHSDQPGGLAILFIFAAFVQMALLGALLTLSPDQLYLVHSVAPLDWGLTPLTDQQLGGLIMWVPAGLPYLVIAGLVARRGWRGMVKLS